MGSGLGAAIEIVDPRTWATVDAFPIPSPSAVSLAVAPRGDRLYVLDRASSKVDVYTTQGSPVSSVTVPYPDDIVLSHDGATLYVSTGVGLAVVDTTAGAVTATVPADGLKGVALSPDGRTVAAVAAFRPAGKPLEATLHLFDVQPPGLRLSVPLADPGGHAALEVLPTSLAWAGDDRVVLWDDGRDSSYQVAVVAGVQDHPTTVRFPVDGAVSVNWNNGVAYDAVTGTAYALKLWHGEAGTGTWAPYGEVAEVQVGQGVGAVRGAFHGGRPLVPVTAPGTGWLYVSVSDGPGRGPDTLDGYDPATDTFHPALYRFTPPALPVRDMSFV